MDVAAKDSWDDYQRLESGKNEKNDSEINGWIEAAFEEYGWHSRVNCRLFDKFDLISNDIITKEMIKTHIYYEL